MKGQLALALSLSPFVIRSRRFHLPPDLKNEACYCGDRRSGEKNTLHGSTPLLSERRPRGLCWHVGAILAQKVHD